MCLLLNSALKFEYEMGPSPTPPPLSFGCRCCSCGSGPISHYNPGLMISPSTVITPVPGAPSLSRRARHTYSSCHSPRAIKPTQQRSDIDITVTHTHTLCWGWKGTGIALGQQTEPAPLEAGSSPQPSVVQGRPLSTSLPACSYSEGWD